jgi:hypothetical protein
MPPLVKPGAPNTKARAISNPMMWPIGASRIAQRDRSTTATAAPTSSPPSTKPNISPTVVT